MLGMDVRMIAPNKLLPPVVAAVCSGRSFARQYLATLPRSAAGFPLTGIVDQALKRNVVIGPDQTASHIINMSHRLLLWDAD